MDEDDVKQLGKELNNWGRWGGEDEIGTLNFITPEKVSAVCRLAMRGKIFSLGLDIGAGSPQTGRWGRINPIHLMTATGTDDFAGVGLTRPGSFRHTDDFMIMPISAATHWDAFAHVFYDGLMWNGYPATNVSSVFGAQKNGIEKLRKHVVSRGVLLDIPRYLGKELKPGYAITIDDLEGAAKHHKVKPSTGDVLLVRTGHMTKFYNAKKWDGYAPDSPGLSVMTAAWLHAKEIAAVASDTYLVEVYPFEVADCFGPWHMIVLRDIGMPVGEMFYLDELASDCAADGVYEFFFIGQPLPLTGAAGSPINPLVIK